MRKLIYFGIAAIAAISLSSCQKEADFQDSSDNLVSVTFRAEKAGETRTAAVEGTSSVSYVWTDEDKDNFKLLQVTTDAENKEHFTEVPNPTLEFSSDMKVLTIKADVPEGSTLRAIVASEWTGSEGEDTRKPKVKSTQNPLADNFDPTADILVSEDEEIPEGETEIEGTFIFNRPVTVNKMTLKQMVEGEKVNKVVISSDENLIGYYNGSSMSGQSQGNVITLKYDDIAVGSTGEFPVYFITIPAQRNNLVVRVYTDKYTYMKSFGTVNFTNGKFSSFGLKLEGYGKPVVDTDFSGEWVITGNNNGLFAAKAFESGNNNLKALPVKMDISKKTIKATDVDVIKMTFTKITEGDYEGFYTIQDANGLYLKAASKNDNHLKADGMTEATADYYWSVSDTGDGSTTIIAEKSENRNIMRFNSSSSLFSCYTSGQNAVTIYPYSWVQEETPTSATVADVLEGGAGTYDMANLLVYAVSGNNVIIGDETGKMLMYKSAHGLNVGDNVSVTGATVAVHTSSGVLQLQGGTFTVNSSGNSVDHGTPIDLNDETVEAATQNAFAADGYHSAVYVTIAGSQNGRYIQGQYAKLYLNLENATYDGKNVIATGYIYTYSSSYANFTFQLVSIEENAATLEVSPTTLTWEANDTESKTITVSSSDGFTVSPSSLDYFTYSVSGNVINVSLKGDVTDNKTETITITHSASSVVKETVTLIRKAVGVSSVTDVLNNAFTGVTGNSYTAWTGTGISGAKYSGQSAGGNSSIQLRTNNNNSGVVTTTSGGKVAKIIVTWNSNTAAGRTLNVYGNNSAYSAATDLYDENKQGTLLGTIVCGTSTELTVSGDYEFVGFRSANSAIYLDEVDIVWSTSN